LRKNYAAHGKQAAGKNEKILESVLHYHFVFQVFLASLFHSHQGAENDSIKDINKFYHYLGK